MEIFISRTSTMPNNFHQGLSIVFLGSNGSVIEEAEYQAVDSGEEKLTTDSGKSCAKLVILVTGHLMQIKHFIFLDGFLPTFF
jgi:hypothetical protein